MQIVNSFHQAGHYTIDWNGENKYGRPVPAGMYFYVLKASDYSLSRKLLLLKIFTQFEKISLYIIKKRYSKI